MKNKMKLLATAIFLLFYTLNDNVKIANSFAHDNPDNSTDSKVSKGISLMYPQSTTINKTEGGRLDFFYNWTEGPHMGKKFNCSLEIAPNSFEIDEVTFDATFDPNQLSVDLDPHGTVFNKPILLTMKFEGIDVIDYRINYDNCFQFIDENGNPSQETIKFQALEINETMGTVIVFGAQIWHFSRYGFTKKR
ncbi:MAG: hypothetical protein CVV23_17245 [Ignavibacteriae bacterium HGW-Ignavibacteriae-2]|jgi:hypothetical protein|nr:MAG: hypothetical protein CVV23_17245 [Ignavibacteriae bacterium HGW-Ignavibacteriae-2]